MSVCRSSSQFAASTVSSRGKIGRPKVPGSDTGTYRSRGCTYRSDLASRPRSRRHHRSVGNGAPSIHAIREPPPSPRPLRPVIARPAHREPRLVLPARPRLRRQRCALGRDEVRRLLDVHRRGRNDVGRPGRPHEAPGAGTERGSLGADLDGVDAKKPHQRGPQARLKVTVRRPMLGHRPRLPLGMPKDGLVGPPGGSVPARHIGRPQGEVISLWGFSMSRRKFRATLVAVEATRQSLCVLNPHELARIIREAAPDMAAIEHAPSMPGQGVSSTFALRAGVRHDHRRRRPL